MFNAVLKREAIQGAYPERLDSPAGWLDRAGSRAVGPVLRWLRLARASNSRFVDTVASLTSWAASLSDEQIRREASRLGIEVRRSGFLDPLAARLFAIVREIAGRTVGQQHFDVQLIGGRVLLHGFIAEMQTGEGKTLTATLPATTAALAGIPVHIITVNDYLAARDAESMGPIYKALGLTVGTIIHDMDSATRRRTYACNVVYCSNKELAFDYLRDRIVLGRESTRNKLLVERMFDARPRADRLLLRGLFYGIVDEADSVLIDEARTPVIISGNSAGNTYEEQTYKTALSIAYQMEENRDFSIEGRERNIVILPPGLERLASMSKVLATVWNRRRWREELVRQALAAVHLFRREKQYLVQNDRVQIIDEYTGRTMPDRSWELGLQQMIEAKESCPLTQAVQPSARISYQRLFRRYLRLAGMTGTAREVRGELWDVYGLATTRIPTNRRTKRQRWPDRIYSTQKEKWDGVVERIAQMHALGRPILVGTRSVETSERLSRLLAKSGLDHQLLNARQDAEEANIIARAGARGRITVATNMAGRGTDIRLEADVVELGGLHVIATELHESRRIDRQLFGRCGRQGDPGTCEAIISIEDELAQIYAHPLSRISPAWTFRTAQRTAERLHKRMRRDLLKLDEHLDATLAFTGKSE